MFGSVRGLYLVAPKVKFRIKKLRVCAIRRRVWIARGDGSRFRSWDNSVVVLKRRYVVKLMYYSGYVSRAVGRAKLVATSYRVI